MWPAEQMALGKFQPNFLMGKRPQSAAEMWQKCNISLNLAQLSRQLQTPQVLHCRNFDEDTWMFIQMQKFNEKFLTWVVRLLWEILWIVSTSCQFPRKIRQSEIGLCAPCLWWDDPQRWAFRISIKGRCILFMVIIHVSLIIWAAEPGAGLDTPGASNNIIPKHM